MTNKSHELVKKQAGKGHNSEAELKGYVSEFAKLEAQKQEIAGKQKDILNDAKKSGFLKTSIRNAVKLLNMTHEQRQSKNEIDQATEEYTRLCADLPLFKASIDEQELAKVGT